MMPGFLKKNRMIAYLFYRYFNAFRQFVDGVFKNTFHKSHNNLYDNIEYRSNAEYSSYDNACGPRPINIRTLIIVNFNNYYYQLLIDQMILDFILSWKAELCYYNIWWWVRSASVFYFLIMMNLCTLLMHSFK